MWQPAKPDSCACCSYVKESFVNDVVYTNLDEYIPGELGAYARPGAEECYPDYRDETKMWALAKGRAWRYDGPRPSGAATALGSRVRVKPPPGVRIKKASEAQIAVPTGVYLRVDDDAPKKLVHVASVEKMAKEIMEHAGEALHDGRTCLIQYSCPVAVLYIDAARQASPVIDKVVVGASVELALEADDLPHCFRFGARQLGGPVLDIDRFQGDTLRRALTYVKDRFLDNKDRLNPDKWCVLAVGVNKAS